MPCKRSVTWAVPPSRLRPCALTHAYTHTLMISHTHPLHIHPLTCYLRSPCFHILAPTRNPTHVNLPSRTCVYTHMLAHIAHLLMCAQPHTYICMRAHTHTNMLHLVICTCVHVFTYMHMCTFAHIHHPMCAWSHMHACTLHLLICACVHILTYMYMCVLAHTSYLLMYAQPDTNMLAHAHPPAHVCMSAHTHSHAHLLIEAFSHCCDRYSCALASVTLVTISHMQGQHAVPPPGLQDRPVPRCHVPASGRSWDTTLQTNDDPRPVPPPSPCSPGWGL